MEHFGLINVRKKKIRKYENSSRAKISSGIEYKSNFIKLNDF